MTVMNESYLIVQPGRAHALRSYTNWVNRWTSSNETVPPRKRKLDSGGERRPRQKLSGITCARAITTHMVGIPTLGSIALIILDEFVANVSVLAQPVSTNRTGRVVTLEIVRGTRFLCVAIPSTIPCLGLTRLRRSWFPQPTTKINLCILLCLFELGILSA